MNKPNIFGLIEYSRHDIFVDATDAVREADRFYIMIEADAVLKGQEKLIAEKDKEIAKLKEESRWHKFCKEKPSEDMMGEEFIVNNGQYSTIAEWGEGYWENDPFCGSKICDEVVWWKYLDKFNDTK